MNARVRFGAVLIDAKMITAYRANKDASSVGCDRASLGSARAAPRPSEGRRAYGRRISEHAENCVVAIAVNSRR